MNEQELQQAFIQWLAQQTGAKNQQELEAIIQQMGEEGLQQAYTQFMSVMQGQQQAQAMQMARHGAKLNYIKSLRGQCPDGYEVSYFKKGGQLCKTCIKKQVTMEEGGTMPSDPVEAFKNSHKKIKRNIKKEGGGGDLPTAPRASDVYRGGSLQYAPVPFSSGDENDLIITAPNGRTLRRKIISNAGTAKPGTDIILDTVYIETPEHRFWVTPEPRREFSGSSWNLKTGETSFFRTSDADIMKRRWNEAVSVSKDKRKKK